MPDVTFNIAKGSAAYYGGLNGDGDSFIAVLLEDTDLEADGTIVDHDTLAAVLAGTSNEQTTMGRKTLADVAVSVDDTNDRVEIDCSNPQWDSTAGSAVGALLICYSPSTGAADSAVIPLCKHDWSYTPDGNSVQATIGADGFYWTT